MADGTPLADEKLVGIMMPFGGDNRRRRTRSILDLKRIQYAVEKAVRVPMRSEDPDSRISYRTKYSMVRATSAVTTALELISNADVVIGVLAEANLNVMFEVTLRYSRRGRLILLLRGQPDRVLPIYLRNASYVSFPALPALNGQLDAINDTDMSFSMPAPAEMEDAFRHYDSEFHRQLQDALSTIQHTPAIVRDGLTLDPGLVFSKWYAFYPYNVVRLRWRRCRGGTTYSSDDLLDEPVVYDANAEYFTMFNFCMSPREYDPFGADRITREKILDRLTEDNVVDGDVLAAWSKDQAKLYNSIVFQGGLGTATQPLIFNANHQKEEYRGKAYLPTLVSRRVVGQKTREHETYLLVVFIELNAVILGSKARADVNTAVHA